MRKVLLIIATALSLAGCAQLQAIQGVYATVTTATVSPGQVVIAANAYDALKATAINYGNYCVANKFPRPICSASNRRAVIKAVRAGDAARIQLEASINTNQPAVASVYNALISAVNALQATPINSVKGS
jgi:hypothetical protein